MLEEHAGMGGMRAGAGARVGARVPHCPPVALRAGAGSSPAVAHTASRERAVAAG